MSLCQLPDELLLKIFHHVLYNYDFPGRDELTLMQRECLKSISEVDYSNLTSTCKRFLWLAENKYQGMLPRNPFEDHIRICIVDNTIFRQAAPESYGVCPVHGARAPLDSCIYRGLYPVLGFKHLNYSQISIFRTNLRKANCISAFDSAKFDKIVRLDFYYCKLSARDISITLTSLKNVTWLKFMSNHYEDNEGEDVPVLERTLEFLFLNDGDNNHPLLHPNLRLPAKMYHFNIDVELDKGKAFWKIMERYKSQIQTLRVGGNIRARSRALAALRGTGLKLDLIGPEHYEPYSTC